MGADDRLIEIKRLLSNYAQSPSLRHMRDGSTIHLLANEILRVVDARNTVWRKWTEQRETLAKSAVRCWIPLEDLREFLSELPGPKLTDTDVVQRLREFEEEDYFAYPREELQTGCLAIYKREVEEGTELPAIVRLLRDHVEQEEERLRVEQQNRYVLLRDKDRIAREQRLLSGADCNWTQIAKSQNWHCRKNGRLYRLSPTGDKMWNLWRVQAVDDVSGSHIGKYQRRGLASKVIAEMAYQPDIC